ncbi:MULTISPECIES: hypothetical protein [unclassified Shewanella]
MLKAVGIDGDLHIGAQWQMILTQIIQRLEFHQRLAVEANL